MSGRGITIRINRVEAMRILAAAMREKTTQFERAKKAFPKQFIQARKRVAAACSGLLKRAKTAKTSEQLKKIANEDAMSWQERKDLPSAPELNLCEEKQLLLMLQNDVRKVIPINSNHALWAILQGKCEVIQ